MWVTGGTGETGETGENVPPRHSPPSHRGYPLGGPPSPSRREPGHEPDNEQGREPQRKPGPGPRRQPGHEPKTSPVASPGRSPVAMTRGATGAHIGMRHHCKSRVPSSFIRVAMQPRAR